MAEETRAKRWLRRFVKVTAILAVFMAVAIFIMASLGGNSETLKLALEEYLIQEYGEAAEIETLNAMTFYPYMGVDVENVKVFSDAEKQDLAFKVDKARIALGFWDLAFNTGKIRALEIQNFEARPGIFTAHPLKIETLGIESAQATQAEGEDDVQATSEAGIDVPHMMRAKGSYNAVPFTFEGEMNTSGAKGREKYKFGDVRPFTFSIGNINVSGEIENLHADAIELGNLTFDVNGTTFGGSMDIQSGARKQTTYDLRFNLKHGSVIRADLLRRFKPGPVPYIQGDIVFDPLAIDDIGQKSIVQDLQAEIARITKSDKPAEFDLSGTDMDIDVNIKALTKNDVSFFALQMPVSAAGGILKIGPMNSNFPGVNLSGEIVFDTAQKPAKLDINAKLTGWDYGPLQKAFYGRESVTGDANVALNLTGAGNTDAQLKESLNGEFSFIGGKGTFPASTFNIWGGGLLNALMPDLDPSSETQLNCAIADFKVEEGVFKSNAVFMDAVRVTIVGDGEYNMVEDRLDLQLEPHTKGIAIGDISAAVNITGPLAEPSISPSVFSLGKKLGGLLLGTINPAFLAFSLTDFGLGDNHPCGEFIKEDADAVTE